MRGWRNTPGETVIKGSKESVGRGHFQGGQEATREAFLEEVVLHWENPDRVRGGNGSVVQMAK